MTLSRIHQTTVAAVKDWKETACRRGPHDMRTVIDVYRADTWIALIIPKGDHGGDAIVRLFTAAAAAFDADTLSVGMDVYVGTGVERGGQVVNPGTGRPWERGEMADLAEHHDGVAADLVQEAIVVMTANRAGDLTMEVVPYRFAGKHLVWAQAQSTCDATERIPEAMIAAMNRPSLGVLVPYPGGDATRAERDVIACGVVNAAFPCEVMVGAGREQRDRISVLRRHGQVL